MEVSMGEREVKECRSGGEKRERRERGTNIDWK